MTLSFSQFKELAIKNKNFLFVKDFLNRPLSRKDLGVEVGSINYIEKSPYYFLRTKALQHYSFLPEITKESSLPIMPKGFVKMDLKEGDLLISKDSNIGEIVILEKDCPNFMLSGAIYKLPITEKKYYLLAFIKHDIFREQLNFIVPRGATIRHAKTLFLNCKIPMPNHNAENTIKFIELLTQAIINKEKLIKERHRTILSLIEKELIKNKKDDAFHYEMPNYKEILENGRLDAGTYVEQFKKIKYLIQNYSNSYFYLNKNQIKSGSTPEPRYIGNQKKLKYKWVTPSHCSGHGTIEIDERINQIKTNNINQNCILLTNRGQGYDCGKAIFYNFVDFGKGQHNQGMYQVSDYENHKLIFMMCFLNTKMMREFCSNLSLGSKMKELKVEHFLQIPFPNFFEAKQKEIAKLYHNPESVYNTKDFNLANFLEKDNVFNETAGIYELDKTAKQLKEILNKAIDDIVNDKEAELHF
jgi:type I restriction enzyme S subunit